ncbi:hypothetical protein G3I76_57205, partial [Streptomyces sp. SID11233]|nr:hypothetical protein [Streptomyces sp. SID11233]
AVVGPRASLVREVDAADLAQWEADARRRGSTRLAFLATAFGEVLAALSGCPDFAVLVPVSRRNSRADATVACRVDTMCLRL